jgi:ligand-binding sensor domain-containing protein/signal transduction histidine kinase/DNA-binding response OmpR family regulator
LKKQLRLIWFFFFIASIFLFSSFSGDQIRFQKIDMGSGLSYNSVLCVLQDHEQFLWIGTRDGLNKYNSLDYEIFKHNINDSLSLSHSHVNCIYETRNQEIWVGTVKGLNKYNRVDNNFRQYNASADSTGLSNEYIKCISEDSLGFLWIGTSYGLNKYDPVTDHFEHITLGQLGINLNNIIALCHDNKGRLWIGTGDGLYLKEGESFTLIDFAPDHNSQELFEIRDIKQAENGQMWIATEKYGVYTFFLNNDLIQNAKAFNAQNSGLVSNAVRKILIDGDSIWLATLQGLAIIEENEKLTNITYSIDYPQGISNSSIHDIIKDHIGGYWLATYTGGLNYYHPQNNLFPHIEKIIRVENILKSDVVTDFYEDEFENVWISTNSGGLSYWNPKTRLVTNFVAGTPNGISSNIVKAIAPDKEGNLWIGTYNGLNFYNRRTKKFTSFYHDEGNANSLNQNQVHAVHVDKNGMVWIGMNGGEFQMLNPKNSKFTAITGAGRIVNAIFEDSKGHLWIGERYGLRCLNIQTKQLIDISHLIEEVKEQLYYINSITEDSKGRLWFGTQSSGLILIDAEKVYWFNSGNGLNDNTVNAVLEDDNGYFWISTNTGISKLEFLEKQDGDFQIRSTNFTEAHGLQGKQFERGSALKTKSGNLLFGGVNGFNIVSPNNVKKQDYYPSVVISEFKINYESGTPEDYELSRKKKISEDNKLLLNFNERNIYLRFAGINFINPSATYYRYRLDGPDKKWIDLGHQRTINFTYLPIGKHELQIKASSDNSAWGDEYTSLEITVLPPWWQTWWAFVIYGIFILFLLYLFFYYSQKWAMLKNSLAMEHFKHEQELALHESKFRFFTDVSHELRTPLTLIFAPLERIMLKKGLDQDLNSQLHLIHRNGNRMMLLINQVLNLRKLETGHDKLKAAKGNIVNFLKEISLAFNEIANSRNIEFEYMPEIDFLSVYYDRDKMESVIYNLLSNAFKHTNDGGFVKLKLNVIQSKTKSFHGVKKIAEISISNNGKAIAKEDIEHIFERFYTKIGGQTKGSLSTGVGLELTKRMVQLHHGEIIVESNQEESPEQGLTTFTVHLPLGRKHLADDEIIHDFQNSETPSLYTQEMQLKEKFASFEHFEPTEELAQINDEDKQSLLIVEDNEEVRNFICDLFKDNYQIVEAENGVIGWEKATDIIPDLIISDIMMPEMDGIELCRKLKTDIKTSHIPIILLTARTTLTFKHEGIETGADEYITKPFSAEFLIIRVKNLLQKRELLRTYFMRQAILEPKEIIVTSVDDRLLKKAVDYITENIQDSSISVEKLSKEIGMSRVHLYRKIKALTNITPVDFIRSIRLKTAASLLKQNKLSIKEIQYMVGFESADYFRKSFKAQYDLPPTEYALKYKEEQKEL